MLSHRTVRVKSIGTAVPGPRGRSDHARAMPAVAACAALGFVAQLAAARIFGDDRREQRDSRLPLFRSVGMLVHPDAGGGGTAFLLSRCHIVTAYHVALGKNWNAVTGRTATRSERPGGTTEFAIGPDPRNPGTFTAHSRATVVASGNFARGEFEGMAGDWAILRLDARAERYNRCHRVRHTSGNRAWVGLPGNETEELTC
jgi:hypothetical protein